MQLGEQGGTVALKGAVTDDGKPAGKLTYIWSVIQGDSSAVSIADAAALKRRRPRSRSRVCTSSSSKSGMANLKGAISSWSK